MAARIPMLALAVLVVGGGIVLAVAMASESDDRDEPAAETPARGDDPERRVQAPDLPERAPSTQRAEPDPEPDPDPDPEHRERPEIERGDEGGETDDGRRARRDGEPTYASVEPAHEYTRDDGATVRDHREGAAERGPRIAGLSDPRQAPPTADQVTPDTVLAVRNALRPGVHECRREHASDAEEGSAVRARVTFSVASERLTVDDVSTTSRGLGEADALESCIESAAYDIALDVGGAEDVQGHPIDLPFRIGPQG